uniref:ARAD1B17402p n=1 Tax=Blastobotrys adeninivorans TaxID=409370 RepID=A0A060T6R1_BLAAD
MSTRTSHKKSRLGCIQCKERRVKCDELKPECGYCVRNGRRCEYRAPPPRRPRRKKVDTTDQSSDSSIFSVTPETASPPSSTGLVPFGGLGINTLSLPGMPAMTSSELDTFDYFINEGVIVFSTGEPHMLRMWRKHGIRIALQSDMLLSAVLSFCRTLRSFRDSFFTGGGLEIDSLRLQMAVSELRHRIAAPTPSLEGVHELLLTATVLPVQAIFDPNLPAFSFSNQLDIMGLGQGVDAIIAKHAPTADYNLLNGLQYIQPSGHVMKQVVPMSFMLFLWETFNNVRNDGLFDTEEISLYATCLKGIDDSFRGAFFIGTYLPIVGLLYGAPPPLIMRMRASEPFALLILMFIAASIRVIFAHQILLYRKWDACLVECNCRLPDEFRHYGQAALGFAYRTRFKDDYNRLSQLRELTIETMANIARQEKVVPITGPHELT